ncbi:MAG: hypothetical protein ACXVKA_01080 [Acidimicrobiia bacterium]
MGALTHSVAGGGVGIAKFSASWLLFPERGNLGAETLPAPEYLYISHPHDDHLDVRFLRDHVDQHVVVIMPDFPTGDLRLAPVDLGFHEFLETRNGQARKEGTS